MNFSELAKNRYSCRKLSDKKVEKELIRKIVETANLAPTAVNKQPFKIFAMESDSAKDAVRAVTNYTFGADTFLVLGTKEEEGWVRPFDGRNFADVDGSIVATHMMMEIEDLGLSTTWVGYFDAPRLKELCPKLADYDLIAIFPVGYKAEDAKPSHMHDKRKSTEEIFEEL